MISRGRRKHADRGFFWGSDHPLEPAGREKNQAVENVKRKSAVRSQRADVSGRGWRRGRKTLWRLAEKRSKRWKTAAGALLRGEEGVSVKLPRKEYQNFFSLSLSLCNSSPSISPMAGWYRIFPSQSFIEHKISRGIKENAVENVVQSGIELWDFPRNQDKKKKIYVEISRNKIVRVILLLYLGLIGKLWGETVRCRTR